MFKFNIPLFVDFKVKYISLFSIYPGRETLRTSVKWPFNFFFNLHLLSLFLFFQKHKTSNLRPSQAENTQRLKKIQSSWIQKVNGSVMQRLKLAPKF